MTDHQTSQDHDSWVQEQLKSHVEHLYRQDLVGGHVRATIAWELPGRICLSRTGPKSDPERMFWVLSCAGIIDHIQRKVAKTPRLAVRHFALKWQLQAAQLESGDAGDSSLPAAREELEKHATFLYALTEEDGHWLS